MRNTVASMFNGGSDLVKIPEEKDEPMGRMTLHIIYSHTCSGRRKLLYGLIIPRRIRNVGMYLYLPPKHGERNPFSQIQLPCSLPVHDPGVQVSQI